MTLRRLLENKELGGYFLEGSNMAIARVYHNKDLDGYFADVADIPTSGQNWQLIFTQNLTTLPSGAFNAGLNALDGYNWYLKGAPTAGWTISIVNGAGIRQVTSGNSQAWPAGALAGWTTWFPFTQISRFNPTAPVCAFMECECSVAQGTYPFIGVTSCDDSSAAYSAAERANECWFATAMDATDGEVVGNNSGSTNAETSPIGGVQYNGARPVRGIGRMVGVVWIAPKLAEGFILNTTNPPNDWQTIIHKEQDALISRSAVMTNPGLAWRIRHQTGVAGVNYDLRRIAVYQPAIVP